MAGRGFGHTLGGVEAEPHERAEQLVHGDEAVLGELLQAAHDHLLETGRQVGADLG